MLVPPHVIDERFAGDIADPDETAEICAWLDAHGVNTRLTPLDALVEYDPGADEWRVENYHGSILRDGPVRLDADGDPLRVIIRRRARVQ